MRSERDTVDSHYYHYSIEVKEKYRYIQRPDWYKIRTLLDIIIVKTIITNKEMHSVAKT